MQEETSTYRVEMLLMVVEMLSRRHAPLLNHSVLLPFVNVKGLLARANLAANVALELDAVDDEVPE